MKKKKPFNSSPSSEKISWCFEREQFPSIAPKKIRTLLIINMSGLSKIESSAGLLPNGAADLVVKTHGKD